jgi:hypothetical protein
MYRVKFLDGSPVDAAYANAVATLISGAARATELCSEDELEQFAATPTGQLARQFGGKNYPLRVLHSQAGYYIGTTDVEGMPFSRESEYFPSLERAERALASHTFIQRKHP